MPFQSEKQRRYLWANEPEIARDWTNTYGNRIQKNDGGIMHHFQNYAQNDGNNVSVPRSFQARPQSEQVNLAYITPQEQQMLQALKPGTPHRGPMEIPNYDSFDAAGGYTSGTAMSAAETGSSNQRDRAEVRASNIGGPKGLAPGVTSNQAQDLRNSFLNARAMGQRGTGIGGFFGGLGRGVMSLFGGIPGKLMSGYMTAKDWATKKGQNIGQGVQTFAQYPTLDRWLNRNTDKYLNKPYRGQGYGYDFNEDPSGRIVKDPDLYADQMKEFRMRYPLNMNTYNKEIPYEHDLEGAAPVRGIVYPSRSSEGIMDIAQLNNMDYDQVVDLMFNRDQIKPARTYSETDKIPVDKYHGLNVQRNYLGEPIGSDLVQEVRLTDVQKKGLDAKKNHYKMGLIDADQVWDSIKPWDDPEDPSTKQEVIEYLKT